MGQMVGGQGGGGGEIGFPGRGKPVYRPTNREGEGGFVSGANRWIFSTEKNALHN